MKKLLIAFSFASLLALPALAQSYGDRSGSDTSSTSQSPTGQLGPANNPSQQFGTDDQKERPNAACPPGSTNPECEQAQVPEENHPNNGNESPTGSGGESDSGSSGR